MRKLFPIGIVLAVSLGVTGEAKFKKWSHKNWATFDWVGVKYWNKPTSQEKEKYPWLFGNGKDLYVIRSTKSDSGGAVIPGEKLTLVVAGYYGWDDESTQWLKEVKYEWVLYKQKVIEKKEVTYPEKIIGANSPTLVWEVPPYHEDKGEALTVEANNTYTITCWVTVKYKGEVLEMRMPVLPEEREKELKKDIHEAREGISWIFWIEKEE